jgi:hypothetical protein
MEVWRNWNGCNGLRAAEMYDSTGHLLARIQAVTHLQER